MNTPLSANHERLPQLLADELYSFAQSLEHDRDVRRVLNHAREALAALSWERFRARHAQSDKSCAMRRRHQGRGHGNLWRGRHGNPERQYLAAR